MKKIPFGELDAFNVVVEVPQGGAKKYAYDSDLGAIKLSRVLYDGLTFPLNYGFVGRTETHDGGNLDAFIISTHPITRGTVVVCRAVGMAEFEDHGKQDHKILAVPLNETRLSHIRDIDDVAAADKDNITKFYEAAAKQWDRAMHLRAFVNKTAARKELLRTQILE